MLPNRHVTTRNGEYSLMPIAYPAKFEGTTGHIILENRNDILPAPQLTFVPDSGTKEHFVWAIDDIVEIKKVSSVYC